jgi:two-component system sensor histidine kinase EvgS
VQPGLNRLKRQKLSETDDSDLKSHLVFSNSYLSNPIVIAMHNRENYVESISVVKDRKLALIRDYGYASKIRRQYPDIDFITVDDIQDGLLAVSTGEVDALLCTLALCSYTIAELGLNNVRIVGKTEFDTKLALGVQKQLPELVSILNKVIDRISPGEQQVILDAWIRQKFAPKTDYALVLFYWRYLYSGIDDCRRKSRSGCRQKRNLIRKWKSAKRFHSSLKTRTPNWNALPTQCRMT